MAGKNALGESMEVRILDFSVVTTIFNDREELRDLLLNINRQTVKPSEIIIVDGGSNEKTINYVKQVIKDSSVLVNYITGERLNIAQGFNKGIEHAHTNTIAIVAVGNKYPLDYFETLANALSDNEALDYVYPPFRGQDNTKFAQVYNKVMLGNNNGNYLPYASNHGVLIKRKIFEEMGYFYERFIYAGEDEEFYKKVKANDYKGKLIEQAMVEWDTPRTWKMFKKQIKVYTIAKMQIYSLDEIFSKEKKKIAYFLGLLITLILLVVRQTRFWGFIFLGIYIVINLIKCMQKGFHFVALKNASYFLPIYYYISQCKYFQNKYHVDDSHRKKV